ncbi:hypothetical protein ACQSH3_09405 [Klebsiella pneumoniae]|uniref:hypothetical protein n=1 Tax=Klebsiella pneumoniae TaxID=573 RepID=UPI0030EC6C8D
MTTDITELAQRLKLEVHRAVSDFNPQMNIKTRDLKELVEVLEKAKGMETYWKAQCRGITDHCEELQARIAELESRTVKLPESFKLAKSSSGLTNYYADEVDAALTAAGINVEAE